MMFEEWWGRTFEGRETVASNQMPNNSPETIRKLETVDLLEFVRSEGSGSVRGLLCQVELRRRENWTARAAIVISIVALVISALSLLTD